MNKILVSAKALQELLAPDALVELVNSAVAQIAGRVSSRVEGQMPNIDIAVDMAVKKSIETLRADSAGMNTYRLPEPIIGLIRVAIANELREDMRKLYWGDLRKQVEADAAKIVADLKRDATAVVQGVVDQSPAKLETIIREIAEREVLALMRGGKL